MEKDEKRTCPHCHQTLKKWQCPPEADFGNDYLYVCFNDECPYFINGWEWMRKKFNHNISYRYRYNPSNGESGPLPVWSKEALKDLIL